MLHSTYKHKSTNEDPKTSAIFENLILLPDNIIWFILRQSCFSNSTMPIYSGKLLSYDFWPHWNRAGTINSNFVEPDLFLEFELFDVIIEAKYGDRAGQNIPQWQKEIKAYQNEFYDKERESQKPFVFIAVGGNQSVEMETVSKTNIYKCNWLSILIEVYKYQKEVELLTIPDMNISATRRLLDNIILAFNINGVYNIEWFNSLTNSISTISDSSIDLICSLFKEKI